MLPHSPLYPLPLKMLLIRSLAKGTRENEKKDDFNESNFSDFFFLPRPEFSLSVCVCSCSGWRIGWSFLIPATAAAAAFL